MELVYLNGFRRRVRIVIMGWLQLRGRSRAEEILIESRRRQLTYTEGGATLLGVLPVGYRHVRESVTLGSGEVVFDDACEAIRGWAAHRFIGATITPSSARIEQGMTVVVTIARGPLVMVAPCRIVAVVTTPERFGFAYGTLPGHPEVGEESFMVHRDRAGTVSFEIVAFSRPGDWFVRVGGAIPRLVQHRATLGYLEGVRRFVERRQSRR